MLRRYIRVDGICTSDGNFIFRAASKTKAGHKLRSANKPISYSTARDQIMRAVREIGLNRALFGLHLFRRGGATEAARREISDRLFKKHGRWRSENAKDGYVSEGLEARLSVTQNLGI